MFRLLITASNTQGSDAVFIRYPVFIPLRNQAPFFPLLQQAGAVSGTDRQSYSKSLLALHLHYIQNPLDDDMTRGGFL